MHRRAIVALDRYSGLRKSDDAASQNRDDHFFGCHRGVIAPVPIVPAPPATGHFSPKQLARLASRRSGFLSAPIFFNLPPHRRRHRVLDLDPLPRPAGSVERPKAFRQPSRQASRNMIVPSARNVR
jgi:hypothetical protein